MTKKPLSEDLCTVNMLKSPKHCLNKSAGHYFCHIFSSLWKETSSKNSVLAVCEISRLFVNILTPDHNYSLSVKESV